MPGTKGAKGFVYSLFIIGTLVIIASIYSTVWASPSQGVSAQSTLATLPATATAEAAATANAQAATANAQAATASAAAAAAAQAAAASAEATAVAVAAAEAAAIPDLAPSTTVVEAVEEAEVVVVVQVEVLVSEEAHAVDADGNDIEIVANQQIELEVDEEGATDTIVIPVNLGTGDVLESFEDSISGVTLEVKEIEVVDSETGETELVEKGILSIPLKDSTTGGTSAFIEVTLGEVTGTGEGTAKADVEEIVLKTAEQIVDLSGEDSDVGQVSVSLDVDLLKIPEGASVEVTIEKEPDPESNASFALAAADAGTEIVDIAYTINVKKTNLSNDSDLGEARISMKVSEVWVDAQSGTANVRIFRSGDDGTRQSLETKVLGRVNGDIIFEGVSPDGLSVFGLIALEAAPPIPAPPGGAIKAFAPGFTSTLSAPDGKVTVTIPPSAPDGSFFLLYEPEAETDAPAAPPVGLAFGTTLFELSVVDLAGIPAPGTRFLSPVTITVGYSDRDLQAAEGNPSRLVLYKYDAVLQAWTSLATTFDPVSKTVRAQVSRLSFFAIMGQAQPPTPTPTATATLLPGVATSTPTAGPPTPTAEPPTATLLYPTPGDVAPGSGLLMAMLIAAFILIAAGGYYLRQSKQS